MTKRLADTAIITIATCAYWTVTVALRITDRWGR